MLNQVKSSRLPQRSPAKFAAAAVAVLLGAIAPAFAQTVSAPLTVTTLAGSPGVRQMTNGTGSAARFFAPSGVAVDASGNLIVADACNNVFRKVTPAGVVTIFAGAPLDPVNRPINIGNADGPAASATFHIGDSATTGGTYDTPLYTIVGSNTLGIDSSGNVFVADTQNHTIRKIASDGTVSTFAGSANNQGSSDGTGGSASFSVPGGVAVDSAGNVYVADSGNDTIRKITPGRVVTTLAGTPRQFGSADGTGAAARFINPSGIAVDSAGNLYVTDTGNHTIRKITPSGIVTTLAGTAGQSGAVDGSAAQARFNSPTGIAVDSSGYVYVADTENHAIRKISPGGSVTTIAGSLGVSGSSDGTGTAARFNEPYGVAVDASGTVYVADTTNDTIRRGVAAASSASLQIVEIPPAKVQLNTNANFTLKIVATGSPSPSYQWSKDGNALSGATNGTLTITGATSADAGNYGVTVTSGPLTYTSTLTQVQVFPSSVAVPTIVLSAQPADRTVTSGQSTTFTVEATSSSALTYQWTKNGANITGASNATYTIGSTSTGDSGVYAVTITDGNSTVTTNGASLLVQGATQGTAPAFTTQPSSQTVTSGASVSLTVAASGSPSPTFQWQKNGTALANNANVSGATTATLTLANVTSADAGSYTAVATNASGTVVSSAATLTVNNTTPPPPPPPTGPTAWLSNLSVRTNMSAGQTPLIVGLTVSGGAKNILVRGVGPGLTNYGVTGVLADPTLQLYPAGGTTAILTNDNWDATLSTTFSSVGAFPLTAGSKDAAFVQSMSNGYTVQAPAATSGIVLVEAYDTNPDVSTSRLTNISARNLVGTGDNVLIEGFAVRGTGKIKLLIRAVGPKLTDFGVSGVLADPMLQVFDSKNSLVASNDNWDPALDSTFSSVGAFKLNSGSKDAAIVVTLDAGAAGATYTVVVKGADGGTGTALVEMYEVP